MQQQLISELKKANNIAVITGAGISAESGIPTFRDDINDGLWKKYAPMQFATPQAFLSDHKLVCEWYSWRRNKILSVEPNAGHFALTKLQKLYENVTIITQNVDGLHQRADNSNVIELHGNIMQCKCSKCNCIAEKCYAGGKCMQCDGLLRPNVVWFGETLDSKNMNMALMAMYQCDILFSIGTSSLVYPVSSLPEKALLNGATLVEINIADTPLTSKVHYALKGLAGEILPKIISVIS
jgi:NAD-dependent deacetylase